MIGTGRTREWLYQLEYDLRSNIVEEYMQVSALFLGLFSVSILQGAGTWPGPWWAFVLMLAGLGLSVYALFVGSTRAGNWSRNRRWKQCFIAKNPELDYQAMCKAVLYLKSTNSYSCVNFKEVASRVLFGLDDEAINSSVQSAFCFEVLRAYKHFAGLDLESATVSSSK